jgi:1A family penicillin-binding protein
MSKLSRLQGWSSFKRVKLISKLAVLGFIGLVTGIIFLTLLMVIYAKDLPRPDKIVRQQGFSTKIFDRNNELLYDIYSNQKRTLAAFEDIPQYLREATVAIEDKHFYSHGGFDPRGWLRAIYNIIVHHKLQGGSTLTQQVVKNVLLTTERTLPRKIKEFILAVQIESRYSKDQILQMYLNESPYGGTAWGVEAASETYFDKKVSELNLVESAILAGLPQRPSYYSPFSDSPKTFIARTQQVLRRMREDSYITKQQEQEALAQLDKVEFASPGASFKAPHFVMYVKKLLEQRFGQEMVELGGLQVTTSLDLKLQETAQQIVSEEIQKVENLHITNGAAVVLDPTNGEILAMVGSKDYDAPDYDGKVNVTLSLRQPGSAIKPVTYATAFKKGYTASTMIMDTPTTFIIPSQPDYMPVNYNGKFNGPLQIRYALGNSINIPAIKMLAQVGLKEMLSTAFEMGITTLEPSEENLRRLGLSVTLGGGEVRLLELASAYSSFANGGLKMEPVSILKATDRNGKVLEEQKPVGAKRVLTPEQAFLVNNILSDNSARLLTFGERNALVISGRNVAVKTGTTNDRKDNWTIGWTPQIMAGVWVGNNDSTPMKQLTSGVSGAAPIWRRIIIEALKDKPSLSFTVPEGIVTAEVDTLSGYRAHDGYPSRAEYFIKGTEPTGDDPIHTKLKLCRGQEKLATPAQIARGEYEEKEYFIFKENDTVSIDGINRWQIGIDEWLAQQSDSRYHPPTDYCGNQEEFNLIIKEPTDHQQLDNSEIKFRVEVISVNRVNKVEFYIDGALEDETPNKPYEKIFSLDPGNHSLKAKAYDEKGNTSESEIKIGIKVPWDWEPSPTPLPTLTSAPTPTISVSPSVSP